MGHSQIRAKRNLKKLNAYVTKEDKSQINNLSSYLKNLEQKIKMTSNQAK